MQIEFYLKENVNGTKYEVEIFSADGEVFNVKENGNVTVQHGSREAFLKHFPELRSWFFND